jgi:uncharacterized protein with PIN domain
LGNIPCRGCGREYDVTLFEFGRTIWCTCGARVGLEPRVLDLSQLAEKRFAADAMLGRLARWLRLLGFDCSYDSELSDAELVRRGVLEERMILTRDRRLPEEWWVPSIHLVRAKGLREQLAEVLREFELAPTIRVLSRCADCNRPLQPVARSDVSERVPPRALRTHDAFSECGSCGRVYWEGSHTAQIRRLVDELVDELEAKAEGPDA